VIIVMAMGLSAADHAGLFVYPGDMLGQYEDRWFTVTRVVDGDTLDIRDDQGKTIRLRLWGIDTPEIANQTKGTTDQPFARQAMAWTMEHCQDKQVKLQLEPQRIWGTYGRMLCYVYLDNGQMLNEQLLLNGLARTDHRFVHRYLNRFDILEEQAQFSRIGLWAN
jgi:micrococcal nuclease